MSEMSLDSIARKLLSLLQVDFPLTEGPFADLGWRLGINEDEVIHRIEQLKALGVIRQISPILDGRSLGYQTTLVAMRVAESQLAQAAQVIVEHPGVSHGYERDHHFNFWFTLAIPPTSVMEAEMHQLASAMTAETAFALPATRLFKIRAYFAMDGDGQIGENGGTPPGGVLPLRVELSSMDRLIINQLQQDLPLVSQPFTTISNRLGIDVADFLVQCQSLKQRGIMRRFGAAINHRRAGFAANAMVCWVAPSELVDMAGRKLAALREVSHCYERKTNPLWRFNLFAMIHGHTKEMCQEIARQVSAETGLNNYVLLFSTKEFKKVRVKYLV